eukprot:tig00021254_g19687.t1
MADADEEDRFKLTVLGWTPEQLLDANLLAAAVAAAPPLELRSVGGAIATSTAAELRRALEPLVLEECRASLAQALERASNGGAPSVGLGVLDVRSPPRRAPLKIARVYLKCSSADLDPTTLFGGSVWLLSDAPDGLSGGRAGARCGLAIVQGQPPSERELQPDTEPEPDPEYRLQFLGGSLNLDEGDAWHAVHLGTIVTEQRIASKLAELENDRRWRLLPFFLNPAGWTAASAAAAGAVGGGSLLGADLAAEMRQALEKVSAALRLNDSQRQAVSRALFDTASPVLLIHGPPGTGKTVTLAAYLSLFVGASARTEKHGSSTSTGRRLRALVCAPTNVAAANVALKLLGVAARDPKFPLRDLALLASEERLEVTPELERVFVKARVQRLQGAIAQWSQALASAAERLKPTASPQLSGREVEALAADLARQMAEAVQVVERDAPDELPGGRTRVAILNAAAQASKRIEEAADALKISKSVEEREALFVAVQHAGGVFSSAARVARSAWEAHVVTSARVVFCTLATAHNYGMRQDTGFDVAVVDEAAQAPEALTALVYRPGLRSLVLAGDPRQLQATVLSQTCSRLHYGRSLFERLELLRGEAPAIAYELLDEQYRMHPEISRFPNEQFYRGRVRDGPSVAKEAPWHRDSDDLFPPIRFINVRDTGEKRTDYDGRTSYANESEADLATFLCRTWFKRYKETGASPKSRVGVISPYSGQIVLIESRLGGGRMPAQQRNRSRAVAKSKGDAPVEVRTVDGFQGGEKDLIIFSAVRFKGIGFLSDPRRLNVAITRAKSSLIVIGNGATLRRDGNWRAFLDHLHGAGGARSAGPAPVPQHLPAPVTSAFVNAEDHPKLSAQLSEEAQASAKRVKQLRKAKGELRAAGDDPRMPGPDSIWGVVVSAQALAALKVRHARLSESKPPAAQHL